jgi:hypothetical protein
LHRDSLGDRVDVAGQIGWLGISLEVAFLAGPLQPRA